MIPLQNLLKIVLYKTINLNLELMKRMKITIPAEDN